MAGETPITVIGNLTGAPELKFTPSGAAVVNFTIASTPRQFDKQSQSWVEKDTLFMRCSAWREMAENIAESLDKGVRVVASGNLVQRSFETRDGDKRSVMEMQVNEIGPSLKWATATVNRPQRSGGEQSGWSSGPPSGDPWASAAPAAASGYSDQPPF